MVQGIFPSLPKAIFPGRINLNNIKCDYYYYIIIIIIYLLIYNSIALKISI